MASTSKLDKLIAIPRAAQLLLVALNSGATDGERGNAINAFQRKLKEAGIDGHELVERLKTPPLDEAEMQKIFDAGRAQGRAEEIEQRQRSSVAIASASPFADGVGDGVNGYTWRAIVGHCVLNKNLIRNRWEVDFIESVAEQLAMSFRRNPTENQAPILRRIFLRWFNGKI
jgi:hypothetical protein